MKKLSVFIALIAFFGLSLLNAQTREVTGTVTSSEDGMGIPGANVMIKGTTVGTATDIDGKFTISVPESNKVLIFSAMGFQDKEVAISGKVLNVVLSTSTIALEEVVVTAYGTKGKVGLKGSIAVVSSEKLSQLPSATFDMALQGKAAGVQIISGSGQPGAAAKVRIRGNSSISGSNEPLYILDNVPIDGGDFASLNTNDFETISVLKDAAATAIYGSRASNGVIIITSKSGKEGVTKVNYGFQYGFSEISDPKFNMMNSSEKIAFEEIAKKGIGWTLSPNNPLNSAKNSDELAADAAELNRLRGVNTDWFGLLTRQSITQTHDFNVSGGGKKTQFYLSYQYFDQEGFALRSGLTRNTARLNLDHKVNDRLKVGLNSSIANTKSDFIESEGSVSLANPFAAMYLANPYEEPYDADGVLNPANGKTGTNSLDRILNSTNKKDQIKAVVSAYLAYDIIDGLSFQSKYGVDYRVNKYDRFIAPESFAGKAITKGKQGSLAQSYYNYSSTVFTNTLDYKKVFNDVHTISAVLGTEYLYRKSNNFGYTGYGLNSKLPESPAGITPGTDKNNMIPDVFGALDSERALFSAFLLANYNYGGKYTLSANLRRDGSSAFGTNNKYAVLWSLGFEWAASQEAFLRDIDWLDDLKIRTSYGTTGNQEPIDDYSSLTTWGTNSYNGKQGYALDYAGDPNIRWEIGTKFNVGFSYSLLKNRVSGEVEFYNNVTSDLFIEQKFSETNSVNLKDVNAGKMRNRGIEFMLRADVVRTKDFTWSLNGNVSYNKNEILDLGQVKDFEQGTSIVRVGLPLNSHYIVKWGGVDPATGAPLYYDKEGVLTDKFGSYEVADFGTSEPPVYGGFGTDLYFKGFEVSANFVFAEGFKRFNNQSYFQQNHGFAQFNMSTDMLDMWKKPGDITEIQGVNYPRQFTSKDIEDASYVKFKLLRLSYTIPSSIISKQKFVSNIKVFGQVQNIYTWTNFTGFDPEDDNNIASYEYPTPVTYTFGVNVSF